MLLIISDLIDIRDNLVLPYCTNILGRNLQAALFPVKVELQHSMLNQLIYLYKAQLSLNIFFTEAMIVVNESKQQKKNWCY